jgi:plastocyanin
VRTLAIGLCLTSTFLVAACGEDAATPAAAPSTTAATTSTAPSTSTSAPAAGGNQLTGTVGEEGDPDAFTITLTDAAGQPVTTLPAGDYTIAVNDLSKIHNWHLKGGSVDETTTVPEVGEKTFQVSLTAGSYTFVCDPHPRMVGQLTVT